jgi:DNA-binding CsgD family transcriptional regulator
VRCRSRTFSTYCRTTTRLRDQRSSPLYGSNKATTARHSPAPANAVLALVARGLSNAETADDFILSLATVRDHVPDVFVELGVISRAQAIVAARGADLAACNDESG